MTKTLHNGSFHLTAVRSEYPLYEKSGNISVIFSWTKR
eukprot:UN17442